MRSGTGVARRAALGGGNLAGVVLDASRLDVGQITSVAACEGSRSRMLIDAPTSTTGGWSSDYLRTEAVNRVSHSRAHPSRLVLGLLRGGRAHAPAGQCEGIANQPCRHNCFPLPTGRLTVRPDER